MKLDCITRFCQRTPVRVWHDATTAICQSICSPTREPLHATPWTALMGRLILATLLTSLCTSSAKTASDARSKRSTTGSTHQSMCELFLQVHTIILVHVQLHFKSFFTYIFMYMTCSLLHQSTLFALYLLSSQRCFLIWSLF